MGINQNKSSLIAHYMFNDAANVGKDSSSNGMDALPQGTNAPVISNVNGRDAVTLKGGPGGTCYLKLPENILSKVNDSNGLTISTWVNYGGAGSVWQRIIDMGKGPTGPYIFLTRNLRGVCFNGSDIAADPAKAYPSGEWMHIAFTISGTKTGTLSSAGPVIYVNGEVASSGLISQTTSGMYGQLRAFFATLEDASNYTHNYIGKSQYDVDEDFGGSFSDFRIYADALSEDEIVDLMCDSLTDEDIVTLARDKYLAFPTDIITEDINLPTSLMSNKVKVSWTSSDATALTNEGKHMNITEPKAVTITAHINKGDVTFERDFKVSVLPKNLPPYTLTVNAKDEVLDISETLFGLFYEDINNAADGGIYAELIQNRSFEAFTFDTYDFRSGENGISTGRNRNPLFAWYGDTDKMTVKTSGGLNEYFNITESDTNDYYVTVADGAVIYNRGFNDSNNHCAMFLKAGEQYDFTVWAKTDNASTITIQLEDADGNVVSNAADIAIDGKNWNKYGIDNKITLTANKSGLSQLKITFNGEISIDMVSLIPVAVWGQSEEAVSKTAHSNYIGNPNYRLRKDLVESLVELHPTFLRFPGGCISEGSYIWDNVYDWKDSVGPVEIRKENFNVWGYNMTMGLGYMEYFQLSEDLNATPLPVMACGVLCQARSDYANPAGGELQDKYIKNFTDLIDFAISTDFENNKWAAIRRDMGHELPFDLHYLGIGNENWGPEFMASFEIFYKRITDYVKAQYPGYVLNVISTVGAQADDDAYKFGWKFLSGNMTGTAKVAFTDGKTSTEKEVSWYEHQADYMETIADEHYYRPNAYLLNNADRYNYYYRAYKADGTVDDEKISKVFVGEYASSDKNTLVGAVAEGAVMTGFENNSDVVRLAATAPLFNKVLTDGTYRWTPDCIWFDDESVWRTPTYYVQQLFAKYIGNKLVSTTFSTYSEGKKKTLIPEGGIEIATGNADIAVKSVKVTSNTDNSVLLEEDFTTGLTDGIGWKQIPGSDAYEIDSTKGLILKAKAGGRNGLYLIKDWTNYTVTVVAAKLSGIDGFYVGAGLTDISTDTKNMLEYSIGFNADSTGIKVYKDGVEGYKLGDFSSSLCAGNLRASMYEEVKNDTEYTITFNYGGKTGKNLICSYTDGNNDSRVIDNKLEAYNKDIFNSVTTDGKFLYIKLVNPDSVDKNTEIIIKDAVVDSNAKLITITGDASIAHVPNVNTKDAEPVVPIESNITISNNSVILSIPANSVNALVVPIR